MTYKERGESLLWIKEELGLEYSLNIYNESVVVGFHNGIVVMATFQFAENKDILKTLLLKTKEITL